jgi:hypothetical protein
MSSQPKVSARVSLSELVPTFVLLWSLVLTCCATYPPGEYQRPLSVVRGAVLKTLPRGLAFTSENGRTFTSNYFVPKGDMKADGTHAKERARAAVTILGASRPYAIEVKVFLEIKDEDGYASDGLDTDLADRLDESIRKELANRRDDRNLIDDFKSF